MLFQSNYAHVHEIAPSAAAAALVVPILEALIGPVKSVVDVGGGAGMWLREFERRGATDLLLVDVPEVEPFLVIDRSKFLPTNLNKHLPALPRCDLAMSLECAEHLYPSQGEPLVRALTTIADTVLFSAAVIGQGGA